MASTIVRRKFVFVGSGGDKFWRIEVSGTDVTVHFGRNGSRGQSSVKCFPDQAAAQKHADKMIAQKLGKGYREVA
jgi:predicted DNA-binding WGR domain protein